MSGRLFAVSFLIAQLLMHIGFNPLNPVKIGGCPFCKRLAVIPNIRQTDTNM